MFSVYTYQCTCISMRQHENRVRNFFWSRWKIFLFAIIMLIVILGIYSSSSAFGPDSTKKANSSTPKLKNKPPPKLPSVLNDSYADVVLLEKFVVRDLTFWPLFRSHALELDCAPFPTPSVTFLQIRFELQNRQG